MKSFIIKSAIIIGMLSGSAQANDSFKLAIIEGTSAAKTILSGDYHQSIEKLAATQTPVSDAQPFEAAMSWCVAKIKLNQLQQAQLWCDKAVALIENSQDYRTKMAQFKSLALNNRAIVKYLQDDNAGAYQDFNSALSLHQSRMVKSNQAQFTELYMASNLNIR